MKAVEVLGRVGSAAAEAPLWRRLERWHQDWKDRPEELRRDPFTGRRQAEEAGQMETALVAALTRGQGWVADRPALERLARLCISDQAKRDVEAIVKWARRKLTLMVWDLDPPRFDVAHYGAGSVDALKRRLALFPAGTVFRFRAAKRKTDPAAVETLFVDLETWLAEQGKGLVR